MSPLKGNWDRLYRKLKTFKKGYALDESEYDSSLRAYLMWSCAALRWKMLRKEDQTPENLLRIKNYYRNLVNSLVITPEGILVMKLGGNPSGSVNTINDNTLILYALLAYAWIMNCPEEPSYLEFELNTAKILVGDDNTWTVSEWAHDFYNAHTVISTWNDIGIITTTDSMEPRPAEDLDFLSAHTIFYLGRAIPVYCRGKLMTSLLYSETQKQSPAFTLLRAAALLQIGWSDTQFRKFAREFIEWLLEHFDEICSEDVDWIQAKSGILTDERLCKLFLGDEVLLYPQSVDFPQFWTPWYGEKICCCELGKDIICTVDHTKPYLYNCVKSGSIRKMTKPDKNEMSSNRTQKSRPRRGGGAKATRQQQPKKQRPKQIALDPFGYPKLSKRQGKQMMKQHNVQSRLIGPIRPGMARTRSALTGKGSTRNMTTNRQQMIVEEDELIGGVTVANAPNFNPVQFPVNIGQAGTFPWASTLAKNFEKYQFEYLEFYYKREVSEFATDGTIGKIIFSFDTDAADGAPTTKQQVEATEPHVDCMPSENMRLVIPARMLKRLNDAHFIRTGGLPGGTDIKTYDVGNFYASTQGIAHNVEVGELHVRYRVRLMIPILQAALAAPTNIQVAQFSQASVNGGATTVATVVPLATADANGIAAVNTAGSIVLPVGNYLIDVTDNAVFSSTNQFDTSQLQIKKNGTQLFNQTSIQNWPAVVTEAGEFSQHLSSFYSSNGSDALTIVTTDTFAAGTVAHTTSLRIVTI